MHREGCLNEFGIHVSLGAPHAAGFGAVQADNIGNSSIKLGAFCVRQKLAVAVPRGPLQRYVDISGPDALQVRLAPRRLQRGRRFAADAENAADAEDDENRPECERDGCTREQPFIHPHDLWRFILPPSAYNCATSSIGGCALSGLRSQPLTSER